MQLAKAAELDFEDELFEYFKVYMAPSIVSLQGSIGRSPSLPQQEGIIGSSPVQSLDEMGNELVKCCQKLNLKQVS